MTLSKADVLNLLRDNGVTPSRALGQNFVADANTVRRVARLAELGPGQKVLEIGAGLGSLTLALAETGACVTAVERDRRLLPVLRAVLAERAPTAAVDVVEGDAMTLDWDSLLGTEPGWAMVANLPYNIATPLVADLLDQVPAIDRMVFMVQAEVAARLVAPAGADAYGAVSVKVAYWAAAKVLGTVPASVFVPRPNVGSALVGLRRRAQPAVSPALVPAEQLFALVRTGFGQRRKMLRRSLASTAVTPEAFRRAGIDGEARAEQLSVQDWGRLAAAVAALGPEAAR